MTGFDETGISLFQGCFVQIQEPTPLFVTIQGAVRYSGIGRTALYAALKQGMIEARKAGRHTVVSVASLANYVQSLPAYCPASGPDAALGAA